MILPESTQFFRFEAICLCWDEFTSLMDPKRIAAVQGVVDSLHEASRRIQALGDVPELCQLEAQLSSLRLIIEQNAETLEERVNSEKTISKKGDGS